MTGARRGRRELRGPNRPARRSRRRPRQVRRPDPPPTALSQRRPRGVRLPPGSAGGDREVGDADDARAHLDAAETVEMATAARTCSRARPTSTCSSRSARKTWSDVLGGRSQRLRRRPAAFLADGRLLLGLGARVGGRALGASASSFGPGEVVAGPQPLERSVGDVGEPVVEPEHVLPCAPCAAHSPSRAARPSAARLPGRPLRIGELFVEGRVREAGSSRSRARNNSMARSRARELLVERGAVRPSSKLAPENHSSARPSMTSAVLPVSGSGSSSSTSMCDRRRRRERRPWSRAPRRGPRCTPASYLTSVNCSGRDLDARHSLGSGLLGGGRGLCLRLGLDRHLGELVDLVVGEAGHLAELAAPAGSGSRRSRPGSRPG